MNANNTNIQFTKYTSNKSPLSKSYTVSNGKIAKKAAAQMTSGTATTISIPFSEFADELQSAGSSTAFGYGICNGHSSNIKQIVTKKHLSNNPEAISRSKDFFSYSKSAGILMIDYDPDPNIKSLSIEEFLAILSIIIPGFSGISYIVRGSISSCVKLNNSLTDELSGVHLYIPVQDASDIPRFGDILFKSLWLRGYGYVAHSASGALLIRTITDTAVYSPERLDFVGKPLLNAPSLHYVPPKMATNNGDYLDTTILNGLTTFELGEYEKLVSTAKQQAENTAKEIKAAWLENKGKQLIESGLSTPQVKETIQQLSTSDRKHVTLPLNFILQFQEFGKISVSEVLNNLEKFNNQSLADPFEGTEYGESTAKLWINNGTPVINSFAHGGATFFLPAKADLTRAHTKKTIHLEVGEKKSIIDQCIQVLSDDQQIYVYSGQLVQIICDESTGGIQEKKALKIIAIEALSLTELLMSLVKFMKKNNKGQWRETNLAIDYANTLLARNSWAIRKLSGIIYTPSLRKDGTLITQNGYDAKSSLYVDYDSSKFPDLKEKPNLSDAKKALELLNEPFKSFPFKSDSDLSTVIAAILTGLTRHSFDNAPLFLITSPKMGTGKGLIISAIAQLVTGHPASVMSQASDANEDRKRLMSLLLEGDSIICIDNIEKNFSSDALCSILTMPTFKDRLLGKSQMVSASTQATFLATGNNVTVSGDLTRRVLPCTIDAQVERPYEREFTINPLSFIEKHRGELVNAALTIILAYQNAGCPPQKQLNSFGSFEEWSKSIRNALVWNGMQDPCLGLELWDQVDPVREELSAVLDSWYEISQSSAITISELIKLAKQYLSDEYRSQHVKCSHPKVKIENLYNALFNVCEKNGTLNPQILGAWIRKNIERIEYNSKLEIAGKSGSRTKYRVSKCSI